MRKLIAGLAVMTAMAAFTPQPVAAEEGECSKKYTKCLNDTYQLSGWLQILADVECGADYTACILGKFTD